VPLWLCAFVALWLCGFVALWLNILRTIEDEIEDTREGDHYEHEDIDEPNRALRLFPDLFRDFLGIFNHQGSFLKESGDKTQKRKPIHRDL